MGWYLLLHLEGTTHGTVDAVEHDEQRVAAGLNDRATMLLDRRVDEIATESPQPFERADVIQSNEAAIANHVCIDDGDQLSPVWGPSGQV